MPLATVALVAFAVFILVNVLFYSSFFTNYPKGVRDALQALALWRQRTHEHAHPWYQYVYWLLMEEGVVMVLPAAGRSDRGLAGGQSPGSLSFALVVWFARRLLARGL